MLEFQPEAHNDEREQGRHQGGEQHSQSFGATPSQLTRLFTLVLRKGTAADFAAGMKYEADLLALLVDTEDRKEAGRAFRDKRKPEFKGR